MTLPPDHPVFAVVAPPRLARFRERLGLDAEDALSADLTGWSKVVVLTPGQAVLFARDHTQVEAMTREVAALRAVTLAGVPDVPRLLDVWEDPGVSAYPVVVVERRPGVPLASLVERMAPGALGDLFADLGRRAAGWHAVDPDTVAALPRRDTLADRTTLADELDLDDHQRALAEAALDRAREIPHVLVHGDLHEGQLLVEPEPPHRLTAILDWQTARVDHPFAEFDLGEWGTALWRGHRTHFAALRQSAWDAYASERRLPGDLGAVFEWHHACSHARKLLGLDRFPVVQPPSVVGTLDEARASVLAALARLRDGGGA